MAESNEPVPDRRARFPFRSKLMALFVFLVLALLLLSLGLFNRQMRRHFRQRIQLNLSQAAELASELMTVRQQRLEQFGLTLSGDNLILQALRSQDLNRLTLNDLLRNEVLPNFPDVDLLFLLNDEGRVLGSSIAGDELLDEDALEPCLSGEACRGLVQSELGLIQWVGRPVFDADFLIGIVIVGQKLDEQNLQRIAFLADVHLVTQFGSAKRMGSHPDDAAFWSDLTASGNIGGELKEVNTANGTYLTQKNEASDFFPTYWVYKSLDAEMASVNKVQNRLLGLGLVLLVLGLIFSHFVARAVSKPILELKSAAEAVGRLDYTVQTHISSHDEFQELGHAFNRMVQGLAEKERIRGVMDKVVSREVAEELLAGDVHLGGEVRVASVLFSDLRGFTSLSEGMAPPKLLDLLNAYFTQISSCVEARHGLIDKYIGDAMMALFGVPIARENHAQLAVESALAMTQKLADFNRLHFPSGPGLAMGIGINSGRVVAGNMGSDHRLNYTVIGDEVNLASRLEGLTKYYRVPVLISGATAEQIKPNGFQLRFLDRVRVKGKQDAIALFQVQAGSMELQQIDAYRMGWEAMMAQQFANAIGIFEELIAKYQDGPAQTLLERCRNYLDNPDVFLQQYQQGGFGFESK